MAEQRSIFDTIDDEAEAGAIAEAEAAIRSAQHVPHDEVMQWIKSWFTADELPCPMPKNR